jgi:polysaccharide chain length determinant protein (PEP-CTERM system associated)
MISPRGNAQPTQRKVQSSLQISPDHYLRLVWHRKWLVLGTFLTVSLATFVFALRMPDVYTAETLILVDPQKVPETYVKSTVTGDVRNRLGTLSQQILSATRLQKIIETLNLYPTERETRAREEVIAKMRSDISVNVVSDFSGSQDLQAFRIRYSGRDPRLVAQVANELATQFMNENLKARETLAIGTTEFLENQLQEARRTLEGQETRLREFRLRHLGEMPEQQAADLQILGQLQSQMQLEGEALSRAEQQRAVTRTMMQTGPAPVVDLDDTTPTANGPAAENKVAPAKPSKVAQLRAQLAALENRQYTDQHPDVRRLRSEIAAEEQLQAKAEQSAKPEQPTKNEPVTPPVPAAAETAAAAKRKPLPLTNPVLESQLRTIDEEISKHKEEQARLGKLVSGYQRKVEAIPINEQAVSALVRDYEMSKAHYQQLLNNQLSAQTATQLEVRQKGEKFSVLDSALPPGRPEKPNRFLIDTAGSIGGLVLGLVLALMTELLGVSITSPDQVVEAISIPVLEVIPVIVTKTERRTRKKRLVLASVSAALLMLLASGAFLFYRFRI